MGDSKDQLTDDEYAEYLAQSDSLCGRLWTNLNLDQDQDTTVSVFSLSELNDSFVEAATRDTSTSSSLSTFSTVVAALEDHPFADLNDEILSSTFIIEEDPDFSAGWSRNEFFDLLEDDGGGLGRRDIMEQCNRLAVGKAMTNPCA